MKERAAARGAGWLYVEVGPPHAHDFWAHQGFAASDAAGAGEEELSLAAERCLRFGDTQQYWLRLQPPQHNGAE